MIKIFLIRHAEALTTDGDNDPDLSEHGYDQARRLAESFCVEHAAMPVITSPLRRAVATAELVAAAWEQTPAPDPRFTELPCPVPDNRRGDWLRGVLRGEWDNQAPELLQWRETAIEALKAIDKSSVIVSHFVLINVLVGWIQQRNEVVVFEPDNVSVTQVARDRAGQMTVALPAGG